MARTRLDFIFLTDPPVPPLSAVPVLGPMLGYVSAHARPAAWAQVRLDPRPGGRPTSGAVLLVDDALPPQRLTRRCLSRTRRARRSGARLLALGGKLAWHASLAASLGRETGLTVAPGASLEAAALVDAALTVLRWRGVDPLRARAVVVIDPRWPEAGEGVAEYLADRTGRVGVYGLDGLRRLSLAERMRSTSGAALEVYRSAERCLVAADLLVLSGGGVLPDPLDAAMGTNGWAPTLKTAVVADLRAGRHATGAWLGGTVRRLAGLEPSLAGLGPGPALARLGRLGLSGGPVNTPVRLGRVLFEAPVRWRGRPEPDLPAGLLSASLVEAVATASEMRAAPARPGVPHRPHAPGRLEWLRRRATELGFRPAAVAVAPVAPARPPGGAA